MVNFHSNRPTIAVEAVTGMILVQLGLRGAAIKLNEVGGNTFDIAGSENGPLFFWMLFPRSGDLDVLARSAMWPLLGIGCFLLFVAILRFCDRVKAGRLAERIGLFVLGVWGLAIGTWGAVFVVSQGSVEFDPPEVLFPDPLYFGVGRAWFVFLLIGLALCVIALRLRHYEATDAAAEKQHTDVSAPRS